MKNVVDIPTVAMRTHKRREASRKVREANREALRQLLVEHQKEQRAKAAASASSPPTTTYAEVNYEEVQQVRPDEAAE